MSAGPSTTRNFGNTCRIYKNSANEVIAIDCISFNLNKHRITDERWHLVLDHIEVHRQNLYLGTGNRVVSTVQMVTGATVTEDSGNFFNLTWSIGTDFQNDVLFDLEPHVAKIGDTL